MLSLPQAFPTAGPGWPAAGRRVGSQTGERAGEIDVDLAHGVVTLAGSAFRLRATGQRGVYSLDDGARVRLPGSAERSRCVALALAADDPPTHLLGSLRSLMHSGPAGLGHDAVVLALAGGGVDAPPFSACTPPHSEAGVAGQAGAEDLPAIEVDQALAGLALSPSLSPSHSRPAAGGGWQRLVFAPQSNAALEDLVDDMLQRLLSRGRALPGIEDPEPPACTELPAAGLRPAAAGSAKEPLLSQPSLGPQSLAAPVFDAAPRAGTIGRWSRRPPASGRSVDAAMAPDPRHRPDPADADRTHPALAAAAPADGAAPAAPGVQPRVRWQAYRASLSQAGPSSSARDMAAGMAVDLTMAPGQGWAAAVPSVLDLPNLSNFPNLPGVSSMPHVPLDGVDPPGLPPPAPWPWHDCAAPQAAAMPSVRDAHALPDSLDRIAWALADECDLRGIAP